MGLKEVQQKRQTSRIIAVGLFDFLVVAIDQSIIIKEGAPLKLNCAIYCFYLVSMLCQF